MEKVGLGATPEPTFSMINSGWGGVVDNFRAIGGFG
ncbi:hypothetical protein SAMN04488561_2261 [Jiangella alba]|uniref:Uncharacterized protein n=1 Tax=Jiangella alba TaxID=561176 RepID=A0A1H5KVR8_9ACTN|nr:hypothetical protein SAMN04488561_2261 [Jiangella alba]